MTTIEEILDGISMEARESARVIDCKVQSTSRVGALWQVWLEPFQMKEHLDESLEGADVWWAGPPKGAADVLSVVPDEWQINLRFASAAPPSAGGRLKVYPPRFLESLEALWQDPAWSRRCLQVLDGISSPSNAAVGVAPDARCFPGLRTAQIEAFGLAKSQYAFLWGPPGTGKTTTLGALLASYLTQFPHRRAILLSTTNVAVDQALIAVDDAMVQSRQVTFRNQCRRIGNHFRASLYENRRHLLPVVDEAALKRLIQLEATRPDPADIRAYNAWKMAVEQARKALRAQAREVLRGARLAAMTTTRAVFSAGDLREFAPYDLVVFDEASQVSLPHALALASLGRSVIFAGDPKQLAPIVQSKSKTAVKWMGRSPFECMAAGRPSACFLNEQSRMAEPICRAVSQTFYNGKLVVAAKEQASQAWKDQRKLRSLRIVGGDAVSIINVPQDGAWSKHYGGPVRKCSAEQVADIVAVIVREDRNQDVVVLVPFRAQRSMIKKRLRDAGLGSISVSTVHRAQGSEKHTIIFDPVDGASDFLMKESIGPPLINVAVSRAKARVVLLLSPGDRKNPLLHQIANLASPPRPVVGALPLEEIVSMPGFPQDFIGKDVFFRRIAGTFKGYSTDEQKLVILDASSQRDQRISIKMFPPLQRDQTPTAEDRPVPRGAQPSSTGNAGPAMLYDFARQPDFPYNCIGKLAEYLGRIYLIKKMTADGMRLVLVPEEGGASTPVVIENLKRAAKSPTAPV
jgi:DNA polymerase III delta prime subunit